MNYSFDPSVQRLLERFKLYLKTQRYALSSITQLCNYAGHFLQWTLDQALTVERVRPQEIGAYVAEIKEQVSLRQANRMLGAIRLYYRSIGGDHNPAAGFYLRGEVRRALPPPIPYAELLEVYHDFLTPDPPTRRLKLMLSLMVFQAISRSTLEALRPSHLSLPEATVYLPATARLNARTLRLDPDQLRHLGPYLRIERTEVMRQTGLRPETVFFGPQGAPTLQHSLHTLFRQLRRRHPELSSARIIRQSVIAHWLTQHDLRLVQHMAGHRHLSSTQRYAPQALQSLAQALADSHPQSLPRPAPQANPGRK